METYGQNHSLGTLRVGCALGDLRSNPLAWSETSESKPRHSCHCEPCRGEAIFCHVIKDCFVGQRAPSLQCLRAFCPRQLFGYHVLRTRQSTLRDGLYDLMTVDLPCLFILYLWMLIILMTYSLCYCEPHRGEAISLFCKVPYGQAAHSGDQREKEFRGRRSPRIKKGRVCALDLEWKYTSKLRDLQHLTRRELVRFL